MEKKLHVLGGEEMKYQNKIAYQISGVRALFTDPVSRVGGEKFTYMVPTYQALKGITESVYWKPSFIWRILRVRVINKIRTESVGIRPIKYNSNSNELSYYTYLRDVIYQVEARFEWNLNRPELQKDWNENKHYAMANRAIKAGGRRDIFLGTRECQAYVEPCQFGEDDGYYDEHDELSFGIQFHSFIYPDEAMNKETYNNLTATLWRPVMKNGVIEFVSPSEAEYYRTIYPNEKKSFLPGKNFEILGGE